MTKPLFASVLHLDRNTIKAQKITDPYSVHRVVYDLFSDVRSENDKKADIPSGIIYADYGGDFNGRKVLIVSDRKPVHSAEKYTAKIDSKEIPPSFLQCDRYRFKLIVNPCKRDSKTTKLVPVKGREEIADWFVQRSEKNWGFKVPKTHLQVENVEVIRFAKKKHQVTMAKATLQGVLQVVNKHQFEQSFRCGIGRGRAFGCGLLQIVPLTINPLNQGE